MIAYAIQAARESQCFDRIVVSTDSEEIRQVGLHYGAEAPFLRPAEFATSISPDIEWITHALTELRPDNFDAFAILRATNPFRQVKTILRGWEQFLSLPEIHSLRAVELCRQHPGKMWVIEGQLMHPLLDQSHLPVAWHAQQYQSLPRVYVQNSSLEIVWTRVVWETHSREGKVIAPFFTEGLEGFNIDYEDDLMMAEHLLDLGQATLPVIEQAPTSGEGR